MRIPESIKGGPHYLVAGHGRRDSLPDEVEQHGHGAVGQLADRAVEHGDPATGKLSSDGQFFGF